MHVLSHVDFLFHVLAAPLLQVEQAATVIPGQCIIKFKHDEAASSTNVTKALEQSLSAAPNSSTRLLVFEALNELSLMQNLQGRERQSMYSTHARVSCLGSLILRQIQYEQPDVKTHAYSLVYQSPATWDISRISHKQPGNRTYVFGDSV